MPKLESQMTTWVPKEKGADSPDHMDAMVWAFKELGISKGGARMLTPA
jgi:phage terminase large subunit-like protein